MCICIIMKVYFVLCDVVNMIIYILHDVLYTIYCFNFQGQALLIFPNYSYVCLSEDQNNFKSQSGVPTQSHILQQGVRFAQGVSPNNMLHLSQIRNIPTFMDEFKYGFPTNGLSSLSNKWWGSGNSNSNSNSSPLESSAVKDESQESCELSNETSKCTMDDMADSGTEDSAATSVPSAVLCSLRRKALEDGRGLLKDGACNGCELHKLNKRQRLVLAQVFRSSLPDKWKDR